MKNIDNIVKDVTSQIEESANVKAIFGDPIKEDKVTIIPVAKVHFCGGGGRSNDSNDDKPKRGRPSKPKGFGGGVGLMVRSSPLGYIKLVDKDVEFVPIDGFKKKAMAFLGLGALTSFFVFAALNRKKFRK